MIDATKSACINHQEVAAVARCKQCSKPVCAMCIVKGPNGHFCSDECKERYATFIERANKLDKRWWRVGFAARFKYFLVKLIVFLIVVGVIAFCALKFQIPILADIVYWFRDLVGI